MCSSEISVIKLAVVGTAVVTREGYPDSHAFDRRSKYYDAKSDPENPRWLMVDVRYKRKTRRLISLAELKSHAEKLEGFALVRRGNRLSIMPVSRAHWDFILSLE